MAVESVNPSIAESANVMVSALYLSESCKKHRLNEKYSVKFQLNIPCRAKKNIEKTLSP